MTTKTVGNLSYETNTNTVLGKGSFGTVFSGTLLKDDGSYQSVAVKRILNSEPDANDIQREVELMKRVSDHPNILRYICTEADDYFV